MSAPDAYAYWLSVHNCNPASTMTTALPDVANDGTTITLARNAGCGSGGEVRLYTVDNGGHTWPGGSPYLPESMIGKTSADLKDRKSVVEGKSVSVRVDLGGGRIIKKKRRTCSDSTSVKTNLP